MRSNAYFNIGLLGLFFLICYGCGEITPLWKGGYELDNYTLYTNEPCQYDVLIKHSEEAIDARLELAITYYNKISRNNLPLSIILEHIDSTHMVQEFNAMVPLKENGKWLGTPTPAHEFDLTLNHIVIPEIRLKPGKYVLKIYADELQETSGEIEGVTQIDARFFELESSRDI